jgi:CBS domain-containing protein/SAM-dependent methyltransferase
MRVREAMSPTLSSVPEGVTLGEADTTLRSAAMPVLPVVDSMGRARGVITQVDILRQIDAGQDPGSTPVSDLITEGKSVRPEDAIEMAVPLMPNGSLPALAVVEDGQPVGVLTSLDIDAQRRLRSALGPAIAGLNTEISPSDTMSRGLRGAYFLAGASALDCVRRALDRIGKTTPDRILDLPSGHGRVLRVLKAAFPDAEIVACDLDREGVDFCARTLGATPAYSQSDPDELQAGGDFDLIWCGSLFTHLDAPRWSKFLSFFARSLLPDGVLVFTTHGRHSAPVLQWMSVTEDGARAMLDGYDAIGFGYVPMPLDIEADYGLAIASPDWVNAQIRDSGLTTVDHEVKGWEPPKPEQDVFTCVLATR